MKKVMFLMAVAGMFAFAACNNNNTPAEEPVDSPAIEQAMPEETTDTTVAEVATEETAETPVAAE